MRATASGKDTLTQGKYDYVNPMTQDYVNDQHHVFTIKATGYNFNLSAMLYVLDTTVYGSEKIALVWFFWYPGEYDSSYVRKHYAYF